RTVAIKVLAAGVTGDLERRERLLREARATAALSHPNIAALYEIGEDQGQLFLVFEFVPGETLNHVIAGRPLNARRAVDFATQIADALADAHAEGIVHRDIKPANIVITPKDKAKILDFGLATWTAGGAEREHAAHEATVLVTAAGTTLGTVAYMSPEQAQGERVDHRTDIFSLGIVLFEMVTGRLPFTGATPTAVALQIVQGTAPPPSSVNRSLPAEIDVIAGRALASDLANRYETAATMAAELRSLGAILDVRSEASEAAGVAAASPGPRERSRIGWLVLLLVIAALAASVWFARASLQRLWRRTMGPAPAPVIAVVPFDTDQGQTFFADGLAEDLISRLGQTRGLKVIGRSATRNLRGRNPRDVASELGAAVVLTGSVRPSAESVKVTLELVEPRDETAIWSGQYTREVKDIFAVQAQIAEEVAAALRVTLQPTASSARAAARTVEPKAYDLYARGRQAVAERRTADAIKLYEGAIAADAGLAEAFAGIAEAIEYAAIVQNQGYDAAARQRLKAAADRAYQLDPDAPSSNMAKALATPALADALGYLRRAIEIDPSYAEGLHQIGDQILDFDPSRAIQFYRASLAADRTLEANHTDIGNALLSSERWDDARREIDAVRLEPFPGWRDAFHVMVDLDQGRLDAALARLDRTTLPAPIRPALRARVLATVGRSKEALQELAQLRPPITEVCLGRALTAGLRRDVGDTAGARRLVAATLADARDESPDPDTVRCAAMAAAALGDPATAADLLTRIAAREDLLRHWALQIVLDRGSVMLRGRYYPWNRVADAPPVAAAREQLTSAYAREREIARTALAGLP
ncbi:MAG TPA: protein kinase, partial [Vicinamibacterales bacterium]|nr:protein kinase [Vicinamibacterales bacterium]